MEEILTNILTNLGIYGPLLASFLIILESIIPILPLCLFVTMNFLSFGIILGFIISYICTIIGCNLAYFLVRLSKNYVNNKILKDTKAQKLIKRFSKIKFTNLTLIVAIPFTPAFLINICAAMSNIPYKKYLLSIIVGKIFMVYFWGFIGLTFVECLSNPYALIKLSVLLLLAYILSIITKKIMNID